LRGKKDERVVDTGQEVVDRDRVLVVSAHQSPRRKGGEQRKEERIRCAAGTTAKIHYAYAYALAHNQGDGDSDQHECVGGWSGENGSSSMCFGDAMFDEHNKHFHIGIIVIELTPIPSHAWLSLDHHHQMTASSPSSTYRL